MTDMRSVYKAIALAVQQQLVEQYSVQTKGKKLPKLNIKFFRKSLKTRIRHIP
ncbi:hypothetical protein H6S82_19960 [Planktothrix sp. FACHB-1355]|uniref:Uncharacterized protein n=1 Tax=Aerosakkonema funiforme FACHB-1375 TaxID=2949571 RepID=A0A926VF98_9CYAN|nr:MULTISPECIES: hypothetical protein [Oscillatoriales]MBD2182702.1 hypothetical protein [Aerosakkonema funiforme FACHB-1375]MBD3561109.1 hypothetical protein [Planktothrix sp. FACHB-1355]